MEFLVDGFTSNHDWAVSVENEIYVYNTVGNCFRFLLRISMSPDRKLAAFCFNWQNKLIDSETVSLPISLCSPGGHNLCPSNTGCENVCGYSQMNWEKSLWTVNTLMIAYLLFTCWKFSLHCSVNDLALIPFMLLQRMVSLRLYIRGCIQKFPNWPPGTRTANGTTLWH
jgi:hypothetical protein